MAGTKRSRQDQDSDRLASEARECNDAAPTTTATSAPSPLHCLSDAPPAKRARLRVQKDSRISVPFVPSADYLSSLSDELLIRILAYLTLPGLLSLAPVSWRFHRLSDDSQLWKAIYYDRFVLPRALRIPGFRGGTLTGTPSTMAVGLPETEQAAHSATPILRRNQIRNWKQQYRLRHNWARGKCAVDELRLGGELETRTGLDRLNFYSQDRDDDDSGDNDDIDDIDDNKSCQSHKMIVKVLDGIAVTADSIRGLRVWELKSRSLVAHKSFARLPKPDDDVGRKTETHEVHGSAGNQETTLTPTSLAVDATVNGLDIAVGFLDGGFDIWQFDPLHKTLTRRFSHPASSSGPLTGISYAHPYVLTATDSVLVSLYVFGAGRKPASRARPGAPKAPVSSLASVLNPPHLLTSLRSHTSRPPLALSIRKLATVVVASIAYTFSTRQGWSIGIQDLHVKAASTGGSGLPTVVSTRLAYSPAVASTTRRRGHRNSLSVIPEQAQGRLCPGSLRSRMYDQDAEETNSSRIPHNALPPRRSTEDGDAMDGPTTLCYSHPYLLATMPDNTLVLHLCTSNASSLAISPGIRLWGHTSGISDAEITARGKAVSVSMRGEEMRVWELEGRPAAERGRSVAIRPNAVDSRTGSPSSREEGSPCQGPSYEWDERRNWVGFDDEMVIVLKESRGGRESLMVYDFT